MTETDGLLKFDHPKERPSIIKVLGVGGGGSNAVNHMFKQGIHGVDFVICNTDAQVIETSPVPTKIQLGNSLTAGNGAGSKPEVGKNATIENLEEIRDALSEETRMVFITAGMGGGTGTGGAPVIAKMTREMGILTIGIVTIPFSFEGRKRRQVAEQGLQELRENVDTLLVINNDKLRELHGDLELREAFAKADNILTDAARGIAEIITHTGYINVDFEDVKTVMKDSGVAIMGTGVASGEHRAMQAVEEALNSPLLNDNQISGASNVLLYITSGTKGIRLDEVTQITDFIQEEAGSSAEIIWGNGDDITLGENIAVTIIATGFNTGSIYTVATEQQKRAAGIVVGKVDPSSDFPLPSAPAPKVETEEFQMVRKESPEREQNVAYTGMSSFVAEPTAETHVGGAPERSLETKTDGQDTPSSRITMTLSEPKPVSIPEQTPSAPGNPSSTEMNIILNDRMSKLKEMSLKTKTPDGLTHLEDVPAYLRRNVNLENQHHSTDSEVSKYTLNDGEITSNSFLHGGID
jgi:cell division protein FtsZ